MKKAIIFGVLIFLIIFTVSKMSSPLSAQAQTTPSCSSLAMTTRTNIISKTTVNVTPGQSVQLVANIINDNNVRNNATWNATGGTYTSKNWDYATWVAPTTPGNYVITYALSGVNQSNCTATFKVPSLPPSCTGIKTTNNTPINSLQTEKSYTFEGISCQNVSTYKWIIDRGNCPSTILTTAPTTQTFPITMPAFAINMSSCTFTLGLQVCNASNQCSQYYSVNPVIKYAMPANAKQWQFNVKFSCANGATPIDTITQASWGYTSPTNQSCTQRLEYPTGGGSSSTTASYNLTYIPTICTKGTFGAYKIHTGESTFFKSASNAGIAAKSPAEQFPGDVTWDLNTLPNGTYTLNYELPSSSCPTPTGVPKPSPCNGIGDVNSDGYVTEADALLVLRQLAGFENFTAEQQRRANVNGGALDNGDALSIRRFIAGLDTTFLACPTPTPPPATTTTGPTCPLKPQGDANCDNKINIQDFLIWKAEFLNFNNNGGPTPPPPNADFSGNGTGSISVDITDFLIWKAGFLNPNLAH